MLKVIIAGGRDFIDYQLLCHKCDYFVANQAKIEFEIVSGRAKGADLLGERYAQGNGYSVKIFPANWDLHGKSAGYKRNIEMAEYADALIAFWDSGSRGTKHMIDTATRLGAKVRVVNY